MKKTRSSFLALVSGESFQAGALLCMNPDPCTSPLSNYESLLNFLTVPLGQHHCHSSLPRHLGPSTAFNATCKSLKQNLRRTYNDYRSSRDPKLLDSYLHIKQCLTKAIQHCLQLITKANWSRLEKAVKSNNSKPFWRLVSCHLSPPNVGSNILAASWVSHFKNLFFDDSVSEPALEHPNLDASPRWPPVTAGEVELLIGQIKNGKAHGPDKIPSDMIKAVPHWWANILAHLFTWVENSGIIPNSWRQSVIIPIFKKGDRDFPSDYRPISFLSVSGKIFASHLTLFLEIQL